MKLPRYLTSHDVSMRLNHCYARHKGLAIYIQEVQGSTLWVVNAQGKGHHVDSEDEELDLTSPPTGYGLDTSERRAVWISRIPYRQQKQGIDTNCAYSWEEFTDFQGRSIQGLPPNKTVLEMIDGAYEPIKNVVGKIRSKKFDSVPFHRNFCLVRLTNAESTMGIKFMAKPVGFVDSRSNTAFISERYGNSPVANQLSSYFSIEVQQDAAA